MNKLCCFFKDTATTEIYPYGNTLALHDALPIFADDRKLRQGAAIGHRSGIDAGQNFSIGGRFGLRMGDLHRQRRQQRRLARLGVAGLQIIVVLHDPTRSEEHTSELQSLMRISYAVFCLKKKKTK